MPRKKILWLCSWYPSKLMPFNGDFIKRHAEAASLYNDIGVIHIVRDVKGIITKNVFKEESQKNGLAEKIIYYYTPSFRISLFDKYWSELKYRKLYKQAIADHIKRAGAPELVHVHVAMKAGTIAMWLKKKNSVPYIISEHWSGYLPEADEKISDQPFYLRSLWKKVILGASAISAVSARLANAIQQQFAVKKIRIIPNVVDISIFYPATSSSNDTRFIHISGLEELKNPKTIMEAFAIVRKTYPSAVLDIFGPGENRLKDLAVELQAEKNIHFHGEIAQKELAEFVRRSLALILYSNYETFGCVIIEANACGIPVVLSDIPVFHETVTEGLNGIFVKPNDPAALAERMIEMIKTRSSFNSNAIVASSSNYSYEKVGKQFSDWYDEILAKKV
ncbi:MAG TPA: glycosyltransferase [Chitinophagaceae bacterium]|nr:glycosyltransferase [Chitinophagaceae bacterium]